MITRRIFLASVAALSAGTAGAAERIFRVGLLWAGTPNPWIKDFTEALAVRGYVLGKNLAFEERAAGLDRDRLPDLTAELLATRPDVILVTSTAAVKALEKQHSTVPVVFIIGVDPIGRLKIAQSLAHPGGNFTGIFNNAGDVLPKSLQMLRDLLPQARCVGSLLDPSYGSSSYAPYVVRMKELAASLGFEFEAIPVNSGDQLPSVFAQLADRKVDTFLCIGGPLTTAHGQTIIDLARAHRWPAIYPFRVYAAEGGLMSYGSDMEGLHRSAADYAGKILHGANPADLPIEQATRLNLVINLKAARELGLTIPPILLANAAELIE